MISVNFVLVFFTASRSSCSADWLSGCCEFFGTLAPRVFLIIMLVGPLCFFVTLSELQLYINSFLGNY